MVAPLVIVGGIIGAELGIAKSYFGRRARKRAAREAERILAEKKALYGKIKDTGLEESEIRYKQTQGSNIANQALTGIELNSPTFERLNNYTKQEWQKEISNINLQYEGNLLGVAAEQQQINSTKFSLFEEGLNFLDNTARGAFQWGSIFNTFGRAGAPKKADYSGFGVPNYK